MNTLWNDRRAERGSAGVKFLIVAVIIVLIANAGINYVPVAYDAESMKTEMQTAILQGLAMPGKMDPVANVKGRIQQAASVNNVPQDAMIDVKMQGSILTAHVAYSKQVSLLPFGFYKYNYQFDHTATPTGFLLKNAQ